MDECSANENLCAGKPGTTCVNKKPVVTDDNPNGVGFLCLCKNKKPPVNGKCESKSYGDTFNDLQGVGNKENVKNK